MITHLSRSVSEVSQHYRPTAVDAQKRPRGRPIASDACRYAGRAPSQRAPNLSLPGVASKGTLHCSLARYARLDIRYALCWHAPWETGTREARPIDSGGILRLSRSGDDAGIDEILSGEGADHYPAPERRVSYKHSIPHGRWECSVDGKILKVKYNTHGSEDYAGEFVFRRVHNSKVYVYFGDSVMTKRWPWRQSFSDELNRAVLVFQWWRMWPVEE